MSHSQLKIKPLDEVTRQEFERYVTAQKSGLFNMVTQMRTVMTRARLDEPTYMAILEYYDVLQQRFPMK